MENTTKTPGKQSENTTKNQHTFDRHLQNPREFFPQSNILPFVKNIRIHEIGGFHYIFQYTESSRIPYIFPHKFNTHEDAVRIARAFCDDKPLAIWS